MLFGLEPALRSIGRDLWAFLKAVVWQWKSFMGGVVMIAFGAIQWYSGSSTMRWFDLPLTILFVAVAVFATWREERQKVERLSGSGLPLTLRELVAEYRDRTTVNADRLTRDRLGQLYTVSWPVKDIEGSVVSLQTPSDYPDVKLHFSRNQKAKLQVLQKGEHVTVQGRIHRLSENNVTLKGCDLMSIDAPAALNH